jgi:hypothetical protein
MNNKEMPTEPSYVHEQVFHIPAQSVWRALGEAALPKLIDAGDVPGIEGQQLAQPGDVVEGGARHEPILVERVSNPEHVINHPANIAKADRDFTAMTGIVIRRHDEE